MPSSGFQLICQTAATISRSGVVVEIGSRVTTSLHLADAVFRHIFDLWHRPDLSEFASVPESDGAPSKPPNSALWQAAQPAEPYNSSTDGRKN